jgi:hypothetical protein
MRPTRVPARCDAPPVTSRGLDSRFTFVRRLTERLAERPAGETALLTLRLLPQAPGLPLDAQSLADGAELLRAYPQRVCGAFVGRLADGDLALCLPAHGVVDDCAASLMAAARSAPGRLRCVIGCVDHLGGVPLGSALAQLDQATAQAEQAGVGQVDSRSARHDHLGAEDGELRRQIVDALRAGRLKLAEFPVIDAEGRLLHLECPMRLRLQPDGVFEPAEAWLAVATRYRLMTQIDLAGLELALAACAADGHPRCVHVAAESLATAGFVSAVRARLDAAPEAAALLWIEIAEVSFERLPPRLRNAGTVWRRCGDVAGVNPEAAAAAVGEEVCRVFRTVRKAISSQGTSCSAEQARLDGLGAGGRSACRAAGAVEEVHLAGAHHVQHREQRPAVRCAHRLPRRSRAAPSAVLSPSSRKPAGSVHRPWRGSMLRRHSSTGRPTPAPCRRR